MSRTRTLAAASAIASVMTMSSAAFAQGEVNVYTYRETKLVQPLERRERDDTTVMTYAWRHSYYAALGMVSKLEMIMMNDGEEEDIEE